MGSVPEELSYSDTGLAVDLYLPDGAAPDRWRTVVLIHGGGFRGQSRRDPEMVRIAHALTARAIAVASIDHRLLHEDPQPSPRLAHLIDVLPGVSIPATVVAAIDDTLTAIEYLNRRGDELGIDCDRLGLVGASTGAITAAHIAYALDDHGVTPPAFRFVGSLWGGVFIDPYEVAAGDPPVFVVHGEKDEMMPVAMSDDLVARANTAGVTTEYQRVAGGTHGFAGVGFFDGLLLPQLVEFAQQHL